MILNLCLCHADLHYSLDLYTDAVCPDCLAPAVEDWGERSLHNCILKMCMYTCRMLGIIFIFVQRLLKKNHAKWLYCYSKFHVMSFFEAENWKWTEWNDNRKTAVLCTDPRTNQMHSVNEKTQQSRGNNPCHASRRCRCFAGNSAVSEWLFAFHYRWKLTSCFLCSFFKLVVLKAHYPNLHRHICSFCIYVGYSLIILFKMGIQLYYISSGNLRFWYDTDKICPQWQQSTHHTQ